MSTYYIHVSGTGKDLYEKKISKMGKKATNVNVLPFVSSEQEWWLLHCCLLFCSLEECVIGPYGKAGFYKRT